MKKPALMTGFLVQKNQLLRPFAFKYVPLLYKTIEILHYLNFSQCKNSLKSGVQPPQKKRGKYTFAK